MILLLYVNLGLTIKGLIAQRHNISSVRNVYPVCLVSFINLRKWVNFIWRLSSDVNFINENKQINCGNESMAFGYFKLSLPLHPFWSKRSANNLFCLSFIYFTSLYNQTNRKLIGKYSFIFFNVLID